MQTPVAVADAQRGNWVDRYAPNWLKPYARLARWDRPIGFWLLFWPCGFSLALAAVKNPAPGFNWYALLLCFIGAVVMRGAGCTFNDLADHKIDMKVERTRSRPLPAGQVTRRNAAIFLAVQALIGFLVLLQFNQLAVLLGVASLALIAVYPFMKRVTWWPQFFLGLAFSWGALLGWAAEVTSIGPPAVALYLGCVLWVIGYDTIYALQDVEDDALIGVKSTARLFGRRVRVAVALFYALAAILWGVAGYLTGAGPLFYVLELVVYAVLVWQVVTLDAREPGNALFRFKANHWVGLALTLAFLAEAYF